MNRRYLRHIGASVKNPGQVAHAQPVTWVRAEDITGLNDGDQVSSWPDKAPAYSRNFTQATSGIQPDYHTSAGAQSPNGMPYVDFVGANADRLLADSGLGAFRKVSAATLFVVVRLNGSGTAVITRWKMTGSTSSDVRIALGISGGAIQDKGAAIDGTSGNTTLTAPAQWSNIGASARTQRWWCFIARRRFTDGWWDTWINGVLVVTGRAPTAAGSLGITSDTDSSEATIAGSATEVLDGQVAEIAGWNKYLPRRSIQGLWKYARCRYNIAGVAV
jgi:hypothetical protein